MMHFDFPANSHWKQPSKRSPARYLHSKSGAEAWMNSSFQRENCGAYSLNRASPLKQLFCKRFDYLDSRPLDSERMDQSLTRSSSAQKAASSARLKARTTRQSTSTNLVNWSGI